MPLDVDTVMDRRRQTRRVAFWRALAILIALGAVAAFALTRYERAAPHIARLPVIGTILSDRPLIELVDRLREDRSVRGVVISIDSPGGTSVGGERLYEALRLLADTKPVVAHINTVGASAGYMTALAADRIFAHRSSLTGSIGVLIQYGQIEELLSDLGVEVGKVESGPLKAEPNLFDAADPEAIAVLQSVVDDTFRYFLGIVEERRGMSPQEARGVASGRIYTGSQALEAGLIDAIGGEREALDWLDEEHGLGGDLDLKTYEAKGGRRFSFAARLLAHAADRVLSTLGLDAAALGAPTAVDGLWSVWHASSPSDTGTFTHD